MYKCKQYEMFRLTVMTWSLFSGTLQVRLQSANTVRERILVILRPGGLRQTAASLLPRHQRAAALFLHQQSRQPGEHPRALGTGGQTFLPQGPGGAGGLQEGPEDRRGDSGPAGR